MPPIPGESEDQAMNRLQSTPKKVEEVPQNLFARIPEALWKERTLILREANEMADFTLAAVRTRSGNRFQYLGYVNVISDRQRQVINFNERILRPENFDTEQQYLSYRAEFANAALQLDIKKIGVEITAASNDSDPPRASQPVEPVSADRQTRKLETLKLEKFSGTVESWLSFWKRFEERVHRNERLSKMEKYEYLRQYSTPCVLNRLKTIPLSAVFYETAVNRLKNEFGSEEKVMSHFTEKLLQVKDVQSRYDVEGLRSLVQLVKSSVAALKSIGLMVEYVSPFFLPIMKRVIPIELYLEFQTAQRMALSGSRSESNMDASVATTSAENLQVMIDFLADVCEDMSVVDPEKLRKLNEKEAFQDKAGGRTPTVAALPMVTKTTTKTVKKADASCVFCKDTNHTADTCGAEKSIDEKKKILSNERRCFRCIKLGHSAKECRTSVSCSKCSKKSHVTSLCRASTSPRDVNCCAGNEGNIARNFMTVEAFAYGPNGKKRSVRVLLDGGAELSFASAKFADELGINLSSKPKTQIPVRMFNKTTTVVEATKVEFRLQRKEATAEKLWISCQAVDQVVEGVFKPQVDRETKDQLKQLNIQLADDPRTEKPIDVVIGLDHLVEFQTHNAVQLV